MNVKWNLLFYFLKYDLINHRNQKKIPSVLQLRFLLIFIKSGLFLLYFISLNGHSKFVVKNINKILTTPTNKELFLIILSDKCLSIF